MNFRSFAEIWSVQVDHKRSGGTGWPAAGRRAYHQHSGGVDRHRVRIEPGSSRRAAPNRTRSRILTSLKVILHCTNVLYMRVLLFVESKEFRGDAYKDTQA